MAPAPGTVLGGQGRGVSHASSFAGGDSQARTRGTYPQPVGEQGLLFRIRGCLAVTAVPSRPSLPHLLAMTSGWAAGPPESAVTLHALIGQVQAPPMLFSEAGPPLTCAP